MLTLALKVFGLVTLALTAPISAIEARSRSHSSEQFLDYKLIRVLDNLLENNNFADFLSRHPSVAERLVLAGRAVLPEENVNQIEESASADSADNIPACTPPPKKTSAQIRDLAAKAQARYHSMLAGLKAHFHHTKPAAKPAAEEADADSADNNVVQKAFNWHSANGPDDGNTNMIDASTPTERFWAHVGDAVGASRAERTGAAAVVVDSLAIASLPLTIPLGAVALVVLSVECASGVTDCP